MPGDGLLLPLVSFIILSLENVPGIMHSLNPTRYQAMALQYSLRLMMPLTSTEHKCELKRECALLNCMQQSGLTRVQFRT